MLKIPKIKHHIRIRVAEESVLIAEPFHIVYIFQREDLMMIDGRVITGKKQIEIRPYK
jgi:hypothetical protein